MVLYTCPRCGFNNKIKTKIRNHFHRKKICQPKLSNIDIKTAYEQVLNEKYTGAYMKNTVLNVYSCIYCDKTFERKFNLTRHINICKNRFVQKQDTVYTESEKDMIIASKDRIIQELKNQIEVLLKNQGNNNVHNNITYNTSIVLNAFGKENTSYITKDYISGLINSGPINSIPKLLEHIHFNPEHIENHNIKIPNRKQGYAEIYNGKDWEISDRKQTIENMTDKAFSILNNHYIGGNEYMNSFKKLYESNDINLNKRLQKDTEIMIFNSQKKV